MIFLSFAASSTLYSLPATTLFNRMALFGEAMPFAASSSDLDEVDDVYIPSPYLHPVRQFVITCESRLRAYIPFAPHVSRSNDVSTMQHSAHEVDVHGWVLPPSPSVHSRRAPYHLRRSFPAGPPDAMSSPRVSTAALRPRKSIYASR